MEASDGRRGWEAWGGLDVALLMHWWVWGSDLELEAERGCQTLLICNEKTTNQEKMAGNQNSTGTWNEGTISVYRWYQMVEEGENRHFRYYDG